MSYISGEEIIGIDGHRYVLTEVNETLDSELNVIESSCKGIRLDLPFGETEFDYSFIDHERTVELMNTEKAKSATIEAAKELDRRLKEVNTIKPKHYRKGDIDLIESWYLTMPFDGFRWAMKSHINKYIYRFEQKNGIEDLDKAAYYIKRLKEKEEEHAKK